MEIFVYVCNCITYWFNKQGRYYACIYIRWTWKIWITGKNKTRDTELHIKHGSPRAVPGITVGHEMVGVVEEVGSDVTLVRPGDRVTVNVETFCGECFFVKEVTLIIVQIQMVVGH